MKSLIFFEFVLCLVAVVLQKAFGFNLKTNAISSNNVTARMLIPANRTYYIAAVEIAWDYAPNATNPFTGVNAKDDEQASTYAGSNGYSRIGSVYRKALYREFTDETFTTMIDYDDDWIHLGLLGPPIRGVVGDRIKIVFFNNCSYNYSMHPHGVEYRKNSEGGKYETATENWDKSVLTGGQFVGSQQTWVYIWDVREEFNYLNENEFSSKFWFYHSHINEPIDTNSGLVGPILITKKGYETSSTDPTPNDIDREFVTLFNVFDENISWYIKYNLMQSLDRNSTYFNEYNDTFENYINDFDYDDDEFNESNLMHSMNGLSWNILGNYLNNSIKIGERIRWYIGAMGTEVDLHTAHWHGNIIIKSNDYTMHDVVMLLPAYTTQVDMITDNPGTWFYHCHVNDHVEAGMIASYTVMNQTCDDCYGNTHSMFVSQINSDTDTTGTSGSDSDTTSDNNDDDDNGSSDSSEESGNIVDNVSDTFNSHQTWIIVGIVCLINFVCCIVGGCIGYICRQRRKSSHHEYKSSYNQF